MGRIISIDFGTKRCGLAVTDELQLIASGLATIPTEDVLSYLVEYAKNEVVERFVIGLPIRQSGEVSDIEENILCFIEYLQKELPEIPISRVDERYTSKIAAQTLLQSGVKKSQRRNKNLIDEISATLILQSYLG